MQLFVYICENKLSMKFLFIPNDQKETIAINIEHISSLIPIVTAYCDCQILLSNGTRYNVVGTVTGVHEAILAAQKD